MNTVAIVGTGLIGSSFALALKSAGFRGRITGVSSPAALADALARSAIDAAAPLEDAVRTADLVYLAQPIRRIIDTIGGIGPQLRPDALVTDAGSTKTAIVAAAERAGIRNFVGGHPLAGKESRGAANADAELFRGRPYVLTREPPPEFARWLDAIGAVRIVMPAEEHDRLIALTSHLPQLLSTALATHLAGADVRVSGPGLADMLRLAGSSWEIWEDILRTNETPVAAALDGFSAALQRLRAALPDLAQDFEGANRVYNQVRNRAG